MAAVTLDFDRKALGNSWLFRGNCDLVVERWGNSISTFEREQDEKDAVAWIKDHRRRPLTEWSDLTDPFEPAGWTDWSPVRSVRLGTPAKTARSRIVDREYTEFLALRRERKQIAAAVAALLTGRSRRFRSDRGRPRGPRLPMAGDVPAILSDLRDRMDACS